MSISLKGESLSQNHAPEKKAVTGESTPRELWNKYRQYLPLFFISLCICVALSWAFLRYATPHYKGTIKLLIDEDNENSESVTDEILNKLTSGNKVNIANQLEILTSQTLMERVVRQTNANKSIYKIGRITTVKLYDASSNNIISFDKITDSSQSYKWQFEIKRGKIFKVTGDKREAIANDIHVTEPGIQYSLHFDSSAFTADGFRGYVVKWNPISTTAEQLVASLDVKQMDKDESVLTISLTDEVPQQIKDILNTLAVEYSKQEIEEKSRKEDNKIKFVDNRLLLISGELGDVETKLTQFREQNNVIDAEAQASSGLSDMKTIKDKMDEVAVKMQVAEMIRQYVIDSTANFDLVPSSMGFEDLTLEELVKGYNQDVLLRESMLKNSPKGNLQVKRLEAQILELKQKIIESVNNIKKMLQSDYDKSNQEYQAQLSEMKTIPNKEKQLLEISRQQGVKEKLYLYLLEKREESAIDRASLVSNSKPIDPATVLPYPIFPGKTTFYLLALFLGLGIPALYIYIKNLLNDKVITREDVTNYTNVPIIGEISHGDMKAGQILAGQSRGVISEQFRVFRMNMQYMSKGKERLTTLITSTMPGEGKTFMAINTGAVLAQTGKKTVLLEFDLRKPRIGKTLGINNSVGISTYLSGHIKLDDILKPINDIPDFYLLPSGAIPPNPTDILQSDKMNTLFRELKERFDYIVVDCPPIGLVSDARVLSQFSDINFYIVRQRYTFKKQLLLIDDLAFEGILPNLGIIINDVVHKGTESYYGYGGRYGYGYGSTGGYSYNYGYGYGQEDALTHPLIARIKRLFTRSKD